MVCSRIFPIVPCIHLIVESKAASFSRRTLVKANNSLCQGLEAHRQPLKRRQSVAANVILYKCSFIQNGRLSYLSLTFILYARLLGSCAIFC